MATTTNNEVIDLVDDSADDIPAPPYRSRVKPTRRQTTPIDLTGDQDGHDSLKRLDELFLHRDRLLLPNGQKVGFRPSTSTISNNTRSDPLVVASSSDEENDGAAVSKLRSVSPSYAAVDAKFSAGSSSKSPAKRKRPADDEERAPDAKLPDKRRRIKRRPSQSRSSSVGTEKNANGSVKQAQRRENGATGESDKRPRISGPANHTHSAESNALGEHRRQPKKSQVEECLTRSNRVPNGDGEHASVAPGIAMDLSGIRARFGTRIGQSNNAKRQPPKPSEAGVAGPSDGLFTSMKELPGESRQDPNKSIDNSIEVPEEVANPGNERDSETFKLSDTIVGGRTVGEHNADAVAGASQSPPRQDPDVLIAKAIKARLQDTAALLTDATVTMGPPRKNKTRSPSAGHHTSTDNAAFHGSSLSDLIGEELSTQLHGEIARVEAAEGSANPSVGEETANGELITEPKHLVSSISKSDSLEISAAAFDMLPLRIERTVGKYLSEMREDISYQTKALLRRSRCSKELDTDTPTLTTRSTAGSVFSKLQPMTMSPSKIAANERGSLDSVRINVEDFPGHSRATYLLRPTSISNDGDNRDVPGYAHYVSLKSNFLAPNVLVMSVRPYFGEDVVESNVFDHLYNVDVEQRRRKLCRMLQARQAEEYVGSALQDLDISWIDVLRFLLDNEVDVGMDESAQEALKNRKEFRREDFPKASDKWTAVLSKCTAIHSSTEKLAMAAILCDNFQRLAKFPLWHVARRSEEVSEVLKNFGGSASSTTIAERTCRVCMRFNCLQHGEIRDAEAEGSDSEPMYESDEATATDLLYPNKVNYRRRVPLLSPAPEHDREHKEPSLGAKKEKRKPEDYAKIEDRGPFYPCNHPGVTCDEAQCSCVKKNITCEKTCVCSSSGACSRKYLGCSCSTSKARRHGEYVCFRDDKCTCYQTGRECDPDLCGKCGVCDVLDPLNRDDDDMLRGNCHNAGIQRGLPKHTLLGDSGVHGMGLYAGEEVRAHDFLGEYKGEVITRQEGDRRAAVYEIQHLSYLFSLNKEQEVDSTTYGNKIRFINHRDKGDANVYAVIVYVNTVHRIGLFAEKHIATGQELFFDYGPKFPDEQLGGSKESAPHVRNANLTREFYDVEDSEDEVGNMRARKAPSGRGRGRPRKTEAPANNAPIGKKGGARPGAGRKPSKLLKLYKSASTPTLDSTRDTGDLPEDRLAAYNIADERGLPVDAAAGADVSEDEDFKPPEEASGGGESSEYNDDREGADDGEGGRHESESARKARLAYTRSFRGTGSKTGRTQARG